MAQLRRNKTIEAIRFNLQRTLRTPPRDPILSKAFHKTGDAGFYNGRVFVLPDVLYWVEIQ